MVGHRQKAERAVQSEWGFSTRASKKTEIRLFIAARPPTSEQNGVSEAQTSVACAARGGGRRWPGKTISNAEIKGGVNRKRKAHRQSRPDLGVGNADRSGRLALYFPFPSHLSRPAAHLATLLVRHAIRPRLSRPTSDAIFGPILPARWVSGRFLCGVAVR